MNDIKLEFWGDMQKTLWVENSALNVLSSSQLEGLISEDGRKAHKPVISLPHSGVYTPYQDINFNRKTASKQTLEVDTFSYAADEIDITDKNQTRYPLTETAASDQMRTHNNKIEQLVMSKISGATHVIQGAGNTTLTVDTTSIFDIFEEADTKLGSVDAPFENRIAIFGPHVVATIRKAKSQRETGMGDMVLSNGVIGNWNGYKIIQNNNLPYTASLKVATKPTAGDTVTIAGVTFEFVAALANVSSTSYIAVVIGADEASARLALKNAVIGDVASKGTTWAEATGVVGTNHRFVLSEKRGISITNAEDMVLTGFGDIVVSETLTAEADIWSGQEQTAVMGNAGMIDLVLQIQEIETTKKEKGFADLVKSLIGVGTYMFADGARVAVRVRVNASAWK